MRPILRKLVFCCVFLLPLQAAATTFNFPLPPLISAKDDLRGTAQPDELPGVFIPSGGFQPLDNSTLSFSGTVTRSYGDPDPIGERIEYRADASLVSGSFSLGSYTTELAFEELYYFTTRDTMGLVDPILAYELTLLDFPSVFATSIAEALPLSAPIDVNAIIWAKVDGTLPIVEEIFPCADYPDYLFCDAQQRYLGGAFDVSEIGFYITSFEGQDGVTYLNPLLPFLDTNIDNSLPDTVRDALFPDRIGVDLTLLQAEIDAFTTTLDGSNTILGAPIAPVTPVPLPASLPLLCFGFLSFLAFRRGT